jgi:hypothetical protein
MEHHMEWWPDSDGEISNHRFWPISISIHLWMSTLYVFVLSSCCLPAQTAGNLLPELGTLVRGVLVVVGRQGSSFDGWKGLGSNIVWRVSGTLTLSRMAGVYFTRIVSHHWHWHTQLAQVAVAACFGRIYKHTVYTNKYSIGMMIVTWSY